MPTRVLTACILERGARGWVFDLDLVCRLDRLGGFEFGPCPLRLARSGGPWPGGDQLAVVELHLPMLVRLHVILLQLHIALLPKEMRDRGRIRSVPRRWQQRLGAQTWPVQLLAPHYEWSLRTGLSIECIKRLVAAGPYGLLPSHI